MGRGTLNDKMIQLDLPFSSLLGRQGGAWPMNRACGQRTSLVSKFFTLIFLNTIYLFVRLQLNSGLCTCKAGAEMRCLELLVLAGLNHDSPDLRF
jgi:hypothetical protein